VGAVEILGTFAVPSPLGRGVGRALRSGARDPCSIRAFVERPLARTWRIGRRIRHSSRRSVSWTPRRDFLQVFGGRRLAFLRQ